MSTFAVCLVVDEWSDFERAWADVQIESTAELEAVDFEWDEDGMDNGDGRICGYTTVSVAALLGYATFSVAEVINSISLQSDALKRGQVRRYAPRKSTIISKNYIPIAMNSIRVYGDFYLP